MYIFHTSEPGKEGRKSSHDEFHDTILEFNSKDWRKAQYLITVSQPQIKKVFPYLLQQK